MDLKDPHLKNNRKNSGKAKKLNCRALKDIRCHQGTIKAFTEGTIQYQFENLGRTLIHVRWNNGISANMFPNEIEIIE